MSATLTSETPVETPLKKKDEVLDDLLAEYLDCLDLYQASQDRLQRDLKLAFFDLAKAKMKMGPLSLGQSIQTSSRPRRSNTVVTIETVKSTRPSSNENENDCPIRLNVVSLPRPTATSTSNTTTTSTFSASSSSSSFSTKDSVIPSSRSNGGGGGDDDDNDDDDVVVVDTTMSSVLRNRKHLIHKNEEKPISSSSSSYSSSSPATPSSSLNVVKPLNFNDPMTFFTSLPPPSLRSAQQHFQRAFLESAIELVNQKMRVAQIEQCIVNERGTS